jgi:hypothetical protein
MPITVDASAGGADVGQPAIFGLGDQWSGGWR